MNNAHPIANGFTVTDFQLARIDSLNESFIFPLRGFLQEYNTTVVVNPGKKVSPLYHIAIGDVHFVKRIFAAEGGKDIKRVAIVRNESPRDIQELISTYSCKIVIFSGGSLSSRHVSAFFNFFFTSDGSIYQLDTNKEVSLEELPQVTVSMPEEIVEVPVSTPVKVPRQEPINHRDADRERITSLMSDIFSDTKNKKPVGQKHHHKKQYRHPGVSFLFWALVLVSIPVLWYTTLVGVGISALTASYERFQNGSMDQGQRLGQLAAGSVNLAGQTIQVVSVPLSFIGLQDLVYPQEKLLILLGDLANGLGEAHDIEARIQTVSHAFVSPLSSQEDLDTTSLAVSIQSLRNDLFLLRNRLSVSQASLGSLMSGGGLVHFFPIQMRMEKAATKLASLRESLDQMDGLLSLYASAGGFNGEKKYLVLFQNSMELRPTGGFIGSVGELTVRDGQIAGFDISDVYELDGQLRGHVDPPPVLSALIGQEHWYLRDSNWSPDFSESAEKARWFYEKEKGIEVDGVIAINVPFIVDVLKNVGPVTLADYRDTITADNFFGKSLYYTQNNFFPGSTQKRDFLGTLSQTLLSQLGGKNTNALGVLRAVELSLKRHDILFYFPERGLEDTASYYGWAGNFPPASGCDDVPMSTPCITDYVHYNEANVGINKANYFVHRDTNYVFSLTPNQKEEGRLIFDYRNTSQGDTQGGGTYFSLSRVVLPPAARLLSVRLDGTELPQATVSASLPRPPYALPQEQGLGGEVYPFAFTVEPGQRREVVVSWERDLVIPDGRLLSYRLALPKQPGIVDDSTKVTIQYPAFWSLLGWERRQGGIGVGHTTTSHAFGEGLAPPLVAKEGFVQYNTRLLQDEMLSLEFRK